MIGGISIYSAGLHLLKRQPKIGEILVVLGQAVILIALFASHHLYHLLPTLPTFSLMLTVIGITTSIAVAINLEGLAFSSIIFAALLPVIIHMDSSHPIFLLSYILAIDVTTLYMFLKQEWGKVFYFAWFITVGHSWGFITISNPLIICSFVWAFYLLFFLSVAISLLKGKISSLPSRGIFLLLTLPCVFMYWIASHFLFPWSAISSVFAFLLWLALGCSLAKRWNSTELKESAEKPLWGKLVACSGMALLFTATHDLTRNLLSSHLFSDVNAILYFLEITAAVLLERFIFRSSTISSYFSLFFAVPINMVWTNYLEILYTPFLSLKFTLLCTAVASFFITSIMNLKPLSEPMSHRSIQQAITRSLWVATGVSTMFLIWNLCHQIFPNVTIAHGSALITYIVIAELLIYVSHKNQLPKLRTAGLVMIVFVLLQLLIKEIWKMPVAVRIITFIIIGLLLVGTALFDKNYQDNRGREIKNS